MVEEVRALVAVRVATLVLFDDELSPAQGKNVEQAIGTRVMDRAELILDIFATRARTSEAKMQVELAQLEYMLPRLTRMWTHLEKFRGGIGMRGPGETQLETDRRLINHRIKVLKERLGDVQRQREVQRQGRHGLFRAALVGYTNAGKSSVLRGMSGARDVFVEDRLFATLDPLTREVALDDHYRALLTDTVGFVRKLPHQLVASFRATLEEVREADLLLHVVDVSHPTWEEQRFVVDEVLAEIGARERPMLYVFNKTDQLEPETLAAVRERIHNLLPDAVFVSAVEPDGLEPLRRALLARLVQARPLVEVRVPASDGRLLAELHRDAEVVEQWGEDGVVVVTARLDEVTAGRMRRGGAELRAAAGAPAAGAPVGADGA
jgi:GTP-binding protein HflX